MEQIEEGYYIVEFQNGIKTVAKFNKEGEWWMIGVDYEIYPDIIHEKIATVFNGKPIPLEKFSKDDLWDSWWASAIKTISFSGVDVDYERKCFEEYYENCKLKT